MRKLLLALVLIILMLGLFGCDAKDCKNSREICSVGNNITVILGCIYAYPPSIALSLIEITNNNEFAIVVEVIEKKIVYSGGLFSGSAEYIETLHSILNVDKFSTTTGRVERGWSLKFSEKGPGESLGYITLPEHNHYNNHEN